MTSFGIFIPFVHLAAYAVDHGHSQATGVALISLIGVGSIAGRFLLGGVADRFGRRLSFAVMFVGMAVMLVFWLAATGIVALAAFAVLFGTFYGGFVALARLYVMPESPEMERLEALLPEVLDEKDGYFTIKGAVQLEPRVVSWRTSA